MTFNLRRSRYFITVVVIAAAVMMVVRFMSLAAVPVDSQQSLQCGDQGWTFPGGLNSNVWLQFTSLLAANGLIASNFASDQSPPPVAQVSSDPLNVQDPQRLAILVDYETQTLTLFEGERVVERFPVAVGKVSTPSPPGEWRVVHKDRGWGGGFGTRWLGLNVPWGIYGIHGTNKPYSIGQSASAGCIRMHNRDVERLWDVVPIGTPVTITGELPHVTGRHRIAAGQAGKFVSVLQFRLRQAGYDFGAMDGRYGPATEEAVRNFQTLFGMAATGELTRGQQLILWYPE